MRMTDWLLAFFWICPLLSMAQEPEAASNGRLQLDQRQVDSFPRPSVPVAISANVPNPEMSALQELERIDRETPGRTDIRLEILRLQSRCGQFSQGIQAYESWRYPASEAPKDLRRLYIGLCFQAREIERLRLGLQQGIGLKEPERTQVALHLALYDRNHAEAERLFERFEIQHIYRIRDAYTPAMNALNAYRPHPGWAGALLSLFPGGGLMYNRRLGAGVATMFLVGASGLAAWGFSRQGEEGRRATTAFATLAGSLFAVNIGLGALTSKKYNQHLEQSYLRRLDRLTARVY